MARFQHQRDNILTAEERAASARKCIAILSEAGPEANQSRMKAKDYEFFRQQKLFSINVTYEPREESLQWLRDLVERYEL